MKRNIKKQFWFNAEEAKDLKTKAAKANALCFVDAPMLKNEILRWHRFQADIEAQFLRPSESNLKWK